MTTNTPSVKLIIQEAHAACQSFSACSKRFFNFEKRGGWAGWEDWLTVEIFRRLNSPSVIPFASYTNSSKKLDLRVENPRIAVEIKVTYISDNEVTFWQEQRTRTLTDRLRCDAEKLSHEPDDVTKLLLLAIVFESSISAKKYRKLVRNDIEESYAEYPKRRWHDCSAADGFIHLLAMASDSTLPIIQNKNP